MTFLILILTIAVVALALWAMNRFIDGDGSGHRPPPPSHTEDLEPHTPLWREMVR